MADILLVGAPRSWPLLHLVPSSWLRSPLIGSAKRMRRSLVRPVLVFTLVASAVSGAVSTLLRLVQSRLLGRLNDKDNVHLFSDLMVDPSAAGRQTT